MPDTQLLTNEAVEEIKAQLDKCAHSGRPYPAKWRDIKAFVNTIETLQERLALAKKWQMDVEEREAAVCPEDVGFDEHIRYLQSQLEQLRAENERLRKQVDPGEKSDVFSDEYAALGHDEKETL